ncbi:hypothetical protein EJ02DRAFT_315046, partial [Clathrospora elynae]
ELVNLPEPKQQAIGSKLLAALQLIRSWTQAGYNTKKATEIGNISGNKSLIVTNGNLAHKYNIYSWAELQE